MRKLKSGVHHETFVVPSLVDGAVALAQAERRRDEKGESTYVHFHKEGEDCKNKCRIIRQEES